MTDEYLAAADALTADDDEALSDAFERDARRYNKAFTEEEVCGE